MCEDLNNEFFDKSLTKTLALGLLLCFREEWYKKMGVEEAPPLSNKEVFKIQNQMLANLMEDEQCLNVSIGAWVTICADTSLKLVGKRTNVQNVGAVVKGLDAIIQRFIDFQ